jgi:hypothetical protein
MKDIMIVDKKSDLNIYKERVDGEPSSSCCATITNKEGEKIATSSCCAPSNGTCKDAKVDDNSKVELANRVANINFNDWVSKYCLIILILRLSLTVMTRLVQYLRSQTGQGKCLAAYPICLNFLRNWKSLGQLA